MEEEKHYKVEVTQLKLSKPFVKILAKHLRSSIVNELKKLYCNTPRCDVVKLGEFYIGYINSSRYERVRVIHISEVEQTASLVFIDCGYQGTLPCNQVNCIL